MTTSLRAADFLEDFDGPDTSWTVSRDPTCQIVEHLRHDQIRRTGTRSEYVILDVPNPARANLTHGLSPARILDERVTASVWVRSNRAGPTFSVRVIYPHLTDPETGKIVARWLDGDAYQSDGKWQNLTVTASTKDLVRRNQLLRAQFGAQSDLRDSYIDRAKISLELGAGATELFIDDLKLGPVVSPSSDTPQLPDEVAAAAPRIDVKMQHDRLLINGQPRFPTILPYHAEPAAELANLGINLAWIPRFDDRELIATLSQSGIGVIATPPLAQAPDGEILDAENAGLAPIGEDLDEIQFWMLGNDVPVSGYKSLANWQKQLRSADRRRQRPLMAGVAGNERGFSRLVAMLGTSRPVHGTGFDYLRYRDWIADRQLVARPGSFMWTWIDTEFPSQLIAARQKRQYITPVIEPEQLRLQTYAALAGGVRGLGYWTTQGLFHEGEGAAETRLMIKQLQSELKLLEPWLATGAVVGNAKFQLLRSNPAPAVATAVRKPTVIAAGHSVEQHGKPVRPVDSQISATLLESDQGTLLLGTWFEPDSQFCPGGMAANDVRIVVPGIKETAKAWEVTTTDIRPLETDRNAVPGGTLIHLPQFESTTAIVISSDLTLGSELRQKMRDMQADSANGIVQLARAKLQRVEAVVAELKALGQAQPDVDRMLKRSRQLLETATQDLSRKDYASARKNGDYSAQMLRVLQRAHWDAAVASTSHATSSPHAISFQTLPDHWRMQARLQANRTRAVNLLPSGDFEDEDTFHTAGWQHSQQDIPGIIATAELVTTDAKHGYSLRLAAGVEPHKPAPLIVPASPVTVTTPDMDVRAGQTIRIHGQVKLPRPVTGTRDGFQISDSISGRTGAIHWTTTTDWQHFEMLREATATDSISVTLTLHGIGEVLIDNLQIEALE